MNGIEALTNLAVMSMVDEDAELLFGIIDEYKQLDRDYWEAQSQINALETENERLEEIAGRVPQTLAEAVIQDALDEHGG